MTAHKTYEELEREAVAPEVWGQYEEIDDQGFMSISAWCAYTRNGTSSFYRWPPEDRPLVTKVWHPRPSGGGECMIRCVAHADRTPSLHISSPQPGWLGS